MRDVWFDIQIELQFHMESGVDRSFFKKRFHNLFPCRGNLSVSLQRKSPFFDGDTFMKHINLM